MEVKEDPIKNKLIHAVDTLEICQELKTTSDLKRD